MMSIFSKLFDLVFSDSKPSHGHESGDASKCPFLNGSMSNSFAETQEVVVAEPEPTKLGKIRKSFHIGTDLLAISETYAKSDEVAQEDKEWLEALGDRVIYFEGDSLINVGVVKTSSPNYFKYS